MPAQRRVNYLDEILLYLEDNKWRGIENLSDYTGIDETEVKKALSILKKMGLIENSSNITPFGSKLLNLERESKR